MDNITVNNLLNNAFPDIIWELETCLGLNWKSDTREDHIILREDEVPFSKVMDTERYFSNMKNSGELNEVVMQDILQQVSQTAMRIAFIGMNARAYNSLVLIPSKFNYHHLGEEEFKRLIGTVVNANLCRRQDVSQAVIRKLEEVLKNPKLKGEPLTLESRILTLIYVTLNILTGTDTQTASFLAQFIMLQDEIATGA